MSECDGSYPNLSLLREVRVLDPSAFQANIIVRVALLCLKLQEAERLLTQKEWGDQGAHGADGGTQVSWK